MISSNLAIYFPILLSKGDQPSYVQSVDGGGIPVINTLAIQGLSINIESCRYISEDDFDALSDVKKLRQGDVLLTMDGGTSIGKCVLFELDGDFTVDSHVAILRPKGVDPKVLLYLLASPLGQLQFQQAESGASGQTAVTEDDVRRFRFPRIPSETLNQLVEELDEARKEIELQRRELVEQQQRAWNSFSLSLLGESTCLETG